MSPAEDGGAVEAGLRSAIAEIEQLRGDLASCRMRRDAWKQGFDERSALVAVQAAEITRLRAENERKNEALEPFADAAREFTCAIGQDGIDDGLTVTAFIEARREREVTLSTADFSRARAALSKASQAEGQTR